VSANVNDWAYQRLSSNRESNGRVVGGYEIKGVAYFSVGMLLGYTYLAVIMPMDVNIWFLVFATLFTLFAECIIFAAIVIMIVQALVLWLRPYITPAGRRKVETYTPWAFAAITWALVGLSGRRK